MKKAPTPPPVLWNHPPDTDWSPYVDVGLDSCFLPDHIAKYLPQLDAVRYYKFGDAFTLYFKGKPEDIVNARKEFMKRIIARRNAPRKRIAGP